MKKKKRCYYLPIMMTYYSVFLLFLSFFAIGPWIIETNDSVLTKVLCSIFFFFLLTICIIYTIDHLQYYYFEGNNIIVKSALGTIMSLDASNVYVRFENLPTYTNRITHNPLRKWICIYDNSLKDTEHSKFTQGFSNNKKIKRIQIKCNRENRTAIMEWIKGAKNTQSI